MGWGQHRSSAPLLQPHPCSLGTLRNPQCPPSAPPEHADSPSTALTPAGSSAAPGLSSPGPPAGAGSPPQPPAAGPPVPARCRSAPGPSSAPASGGAAGEGTAVRPPPGGPVAVAMPPARCPSIAGSRELPPPGLTFVSSSSRSCSSSTFLASSACWGWEHTASLAGTWGEPRAQLARTGTAGQSLAPQFPPRGSLASASCGAPRVGECPYEPPASP